MTKKPLNALNYTPDVAIEAAFGRQPLLRTALAEKWGYEAGESLETLVKSALAAMAESE